jgi:hypothetical protein
MALVAVPQASLPGNYAVSDGAGRKVAGFSLNIRPDESDLERVPAAEIAEALGPDSILQLGRSVHLTDALRESKPPPVELLPLLMMALLLLLACESLLATRFTRRPPEPAPGPPPLPAINGPENGPERGTLEPAREAEGVRS